ncbi:penicillin-binding transpeptidase domain-containing protein [Prauserella cavernicola]|uniref:Penicillin-binding protein n=1 Tax=Prauserella cavernicola TaxID=2800127 RepID=A0A934V5P9_9PSEU|nr:penicillin-binding transpeptidase domain-containing protein [Prauserella cavernicola]MBK1786732.1 penicillin-binding protein [Prauserella cavernicola]
MRAGGHRIGAALVCAAFVVSGCGVFGGPEPGDAVDEFIAALAEGDTAAAAALTDSPEVAKGALDQVRGALEPKSVEGSVGSVAEEGDGGATVDYRFDWGLGDDRRWSYDAQAQLHEVDGEWKLRWAPTVLHPELGIQQGLALRTETAPPAPVLDRDGAPLLQADTVIGVVVDGQAAGDELDAVAGRLARELGRIEPSITKRSILDGVKGTEQGTGYLAASLRSADYQRIKPAIYELAGVRFTSEERLLSAERGLGSQVLPAIRSAVAERIAGRQGWRVVTTDPTGAEIDELHAERARPADAVSATLSLGAQRAAEDALDGVPGVAAIVALRPDSGELLAIAQNEAADEQGAIALTGRYPPGSTFKIATAAAAMSAGEAGPDTRVDCPPTTTIEGRRIPNDDEFGLGKVPLHTAFARSCNTTFARLAVDLPPDALTTAARDLGIGADFVIPGITTITGSAPAADDVVQRAENGFGQGTTLASPFGMAVAAGTVAAGQTPVPSLLTGERTEAKHLGEPLAPDVLDALRAMMREVVTDGTATALAGLPGVHGKTGTAQFGDGTRSHGWFAGYQGDVAFSVLCVDAGSSRPAVEAAQRFLGALG